MNAANGDALLARVRAGAMVTIRLPNGAQLVGRAARNGDGWIVRGRDSMPHAVTADTITRVQP